MSHMDKEQLSAVKEALHLSRAPPVALCLEDEQKRVLDFSKSCVEQEKAGSLYVCGCPGTGQCLSMQKVKESVVNWAGEVTVRLDFWALFSRRPKRR